MLRVTTTSHDGCNNGDRLLAMGALKGNHKYIFAQGDYANPCRFFDISIYDNLFRLMYTEV